MAEKLCPLGSRPSSWFDLAEDIFEHNKCIDYSFMQSEVKNVESKVHQRWSLDDLAKKILLKQRRDAVVHKALMTGAITPLDF